MAFSFSHLSKTHRFPFTVWFQPLPAEPLKGAIDCIFNPVSWGRAVQLSTEAAGPGVTQTVGVSDCVDCWPGKGRSNFRPHRLMVVKINTLPLPRGKGLESLKPNR